ncbi:MAG: phosphoribosylamine--glycine ligase [Ignavibacteriales bacterium]|nr:phosphoribosylamine--glycine ligase [Ignavibacteriales bacterium]
MKKKNVLLIGSGGREHALAYKISLSNSLNKLFISPGNPGTIPVGKNISIDINDPTALINFCNKNEIDLVVVGPEQPLVDGLADALRANGFLVFGPSAKAAEIESHKSFAKGLMKKYSIPTAEYEKFSSSEIFEAKQYIKKSAYPLVIKADGLAAGKGVIICSNQDEADKAVDEIFVNNIFGVSGSKIIIEEFMQGEEASIFAVTDGEKFLCLPSAQDHKKIGDNDTGKNTGGMGAYSPAPIITNELLEDIKRTIISPVLNALNLEGRKFIGCLYAGLMITESGAKVVEFNCRFGDPETQAVVLTLNGDFLQLLYSAASGCLDTECCRYNGGSAVCVVAASSGYPDKYQKGFEITGLDYKEDGVIIFQSGTRELDGKILTNGGRVLGVTAFSESLNIRSAKIKAYKALNHIHFKDIYFRKDIADKALNKI